MLKRKVKVTDGSCHSFVRRIVCDRGHRFRSGCAITRATTWIASVSLGRDGRLVVGNVEQVKGHETRRAMDEGIRLCREKSKLRDENGLEYKCRHSQGPKEPSIV